MIFNNNSEKDEKHITISTNAVSTISFCTLIRPHLILTLFPGYMNKLSRVEMNIKKRLLTFAQFWHVASIMSLSSRNSDENATLIVMSTGNSFATMKNATNIFCTTNILDGFWV